MVTPEKEGSNRVTFRFLGLKTDKKRILFLVDMNRFLAPHDELVRATVVRANLTTVREEVASLDAAASKRALAALREARTELLDPAVDAHGGRIVKTTGDGVLVEFGSAMRYLANPDNMDTATALDIFAQVFYNFSCMQVFFFCQVFRNIAT